MTDVPGAIPVTTPLPPTVATPVTELLHPPPVTASVNGVIAPTQMVVAPMIGKVTGKGLTVTITVAAAVPQPLVTE